MRSEVWSSKWVFILAAIGAAAGLGNLWRFPYMVYENGGGAFLFAYLLVLFGMGIPLVIMEVAFGQKSQTEIIEAYSNIAGKFGRFVGWLVLTIIIALSGYYAAIIAWGFDFLVASPGLAWGADAQTYFHEQVLNLTSGPEVWGGFSKPVLLGLLATYLGVYFSIFKGLKSVGAVVKWTVPLPFLLLFILFLNTMTLDGAAQGFAYFLIPEWSKLGSLELWKNAVSQAFFSMNIGLVLTIMYASFNKKREKVVQSGLLIALGDTAVSLVAGFAMFGTLGWMAQNQGVAITEVIESGPTLAFVTFPTALAQLPFSPGFFATIFFLSILTLAIDSMFALLEAVSVTLKNQFKVFQKIKNEIWIGGLCVLFFCWSLAFAGGNGLYRLDILDHYLFGHLFYWGLIAQIILMGWFAPVAEIRKYINQVSDFKIGFCFDWLIKYIAPAIFIFLYFSTLPKELKGNYEGYADGPLFWWGTFPVLLCLVFSIGMALFAGPKKSD